MSDREAALAGLVRDLCEELEGEIRSRFGDVTHPFMQKRLMRDLALVEQARKFLRDNNLDQHRVMFLKDPRP